MLLNLETITESLSAWPGVTSVIQWGDHLVWKVEGKMFSIMSFADSGAAIEAFSIKVNNAEHWDELVAQEGMERMSHSTGKNWVSLTRGAVVRQSEAIEMIRASYEKVRSGLPKKVQAALAAQE